MEVIVTRRGSKEMEVIVTWRGSKEMEVIVTRRGSKEMEVIVTRRGSKEMYLANCTHVYSSTRCILSTLLHLMYVKLVSFLYFSPVPI